MSSNSRGLLAWLGLGARNCCFRQLALRAVQSCFHAPVHFIQDLDRKRVVLDFVPVRGDARARFDRAIKT